MWRQCIAPVVFALLAVSSPAQETRTEPRNAPVKQELPPEIVNMKNPVAPSAASIATGEKLFATDCAMCHGLAGDGKGELAESAKLSPPDFRDEAAMKKFTDGELFYIVTNGRGAMPGEGKRATPNQVWNLVNFVRSFAQKKPSPGAIVP